MLSIEECRRLLGPIDLSDEEVAELRDTLDAFARAMIDGLLKGTPPTYPRQIDKRSERA